MKDKNRLDLWILFPCLLLALMFHNGCRKSDDSPLIPAVPDSVTDIDGHIYHTVKIGTQAWLVENIRTTRYRNGDIVPEVTDPAGWGSVTTGASCAYGNNDGLVLKFGRLYNWKAVTDPRGLCPAGWHVPTEAEWSVLMNFLGGEGNAGGKLKEEGTGNWMQPNTAATNSSGFTALPAGYRNNQGDFGNITASTIFWSTTEHDSTHAWYHYLYYNYGGMYKDFYHDKAHGFSVRCIMDH